MPLSQAELQVRSLLEKEVADPRNKEYFLQYEALKRAEMLADRTKDKDKPKKRNNGYHILKRRPSRPEMAIAAYDIPPQQPEAKVDQKTIDQNVRELDEALSALNK